jgi:enoyl-CoA hydratase/carnithine racemase
VSALSDYGKRYQYARFDRRDDGLLRVTMHTNDGPLAYGRHVHEEWRTMWRDIAQDERNRVVIITGAGDAFIPARAAIPGGKDRAKTYTPLGYHELWRASVAHIMDLLSIPVPVIAAVNGSARVHAEIALLSDTVLATPDAEFQDQPHLPTQIVPGDGVHVLMPYLMGKVRGSYYLLYGQRVGAKEALAMGLVNEIVERDKLLARAEELAGILLRQPDHNLRYTRMLLNHDIKARMHDLLGLGAAVQGLASLSNDWTNWEAPAV